MPASPIRLTTSDGVSLVADFVPSGSKDLATVVCHGFTGSARTPSVQAIVERIAADGIAVLAPDFRGHGRSGGLGTAGDLEVRDLAAAVSWLRGQGFATVAVLAGRWVAPSCCAMPDWAAMPTLWSR